MRLASEWEKTLYLVLASTYNIVNDEVCHMEHDENSTSWMDRKKKKKNRMKSEFLFLNVLLVIQNNES